VRPVAPAGKLKGWPGRYWRNSAPRGATNDGGGRMAEAIVIKVEKGQNIEETAEGLALDASSVFQKLFPDEWKQAMTVLIETANELVCQDAE
jgi:hypothetical protein